MDISEVISLFLSTAEEVVARQRAVIKRVAPKEAVELPQTWHVLRDKVSKWLADKENKTELVSPMKSSILPKNTAKSMFDINDDLALSESDGDSIVVTKEEEEELLKKSPRTRDPRLTLREVLTPREILDQQYSKPVNEIRFPERTNRDGKDESGITKRTKLTEPSRPKHSLSQKLQLRLNPHRK